MKKIFIGGTGRSGTSILIRLLHKHPEVLCFHEPKLHIRNTGGIIDFIEGRATRKEFKRYILSSALRKILENGRHMGYEDIDSVYTQSQFEDLLDSSYTNDTNRIKASASFLDGLFSIGLNHYRKKHVVEKEPHTVLTVPTLNRMFPGLRYIHIFREPKDVCSSVLSFDVNTVSRKKINNTRDFSIWYADLMEKAYEAQASVPKENYIALKFEELIDNPVATLSRLFDLTGLDYSDDILRNCASAATVGGAHIGRWKDSMSAEEAKAVDDICNPIYNKFLELSLRV